MSTLVLGLVVLVIWIILAAAVMSVLLSAAKSAMSNPFAERHGDDDGSEG